MSVKKVLIIGLDGASWDLLNPFIERGHMPHLKKLRDEGVWGVLRSTEPPITPAAWTSMITGVSPGKHKVFGFSRYDPATNESRLYNSEDIRYETMWSYLSRLKFKVASLNLPMTYPPYPVNGVMVSGFGCPSKKSSFTYPEDLKEQVLEHVPDYDMTIQWEKDNRNSDASFVRNIEYCKKAFKGVFDLTRYVDEHYDWDVLLAQFQQTDSMQHRILDDLGPPGWEKRPKRAKLVFDLFRYLDEIMGKIIELADGSDSLVIIASDHGLRSQHAKVKVNKFLEQWGYLKTRKGFLLKLLHRLRKKKGMLLRKLSPPCRPIQKFDRIDPDWSRTKAFVAQLSFYAFVHLNVKERYPQGIVDINKDYPRLLKELKERFLELKDPKTGTQIFPEVRTTQEMFGLSSEEAAQIADLVLIHEDSYFPTRTLTGKKPIKYVKTQNHGQHSMEGMYLMYGSNIKKGLQIDAEIIDIVPTIYAALGVPLLKNLDGRLLSDAFEEPPVTTLADEDGDSRGHGATPASSNVYSEEEEELVQKRLADLGYME